MITDNKKRPAFAGLFLFYGNIDFFLHFADRNGKTEVYHKIDNCGGAEKDENILCGDGVTGEGVCGGHKLSDGKHQFRNAYLCKIRGIFYDGDGLACKGGDYAAESLRQNDVYNYLQKAEALASARFYLSFGNGIKSAADDFGNNGGIKNNRCHKRP